MIDLKDALFRLEQNRLYAMGDIPKSPSVNDLLLVLVNQIDTYLKYLYESNRIANDYALSITEQLQHSSVQNSSEQN